MSLISFWISFRDTTAGSNSTVTLLFLVLAVASTTPRSFSAFTTLCSQRPQDIPITSNVIFCIITILSCVCGFSIPQPTGVGKQKILDKCGFVWYIWGVYSRCSENGACARFCLVSRFKSRQLLGWKPSNYHLLLYPPLSCAGTYPCVGAFYSPSSSFMAGRATISLPAMPCKSPYMPYILADIFWIIFSCFAQRVWVCFFSCSSCFAISLWASIK